MLSHSLFSLSLIFFFLCFLPLFVFFPSTLSPSLFPLYPLFLFSFFSLLSLSPFFCFLFPLLSLPPLLSHSFPSLSPHPTTSPFQPFLDVFFYVEQHTRIVSSSPRKPVSHPLVFFSFVLCNPLSRSQVWLMRFCPTFGRSVKAALEVAVACLKRAGPAGSRSNPTRFTVRNFCPPSSRLCPILLPTYLPTPR